MAEVRAAPFAGGKGVDSEMFARALIAFVALPGVVAGLVPWLIVGGDLRPGPGAIPGIALSAVGTFVLLWCVRDFYVSGKGTLAPWSPPQRLVVVGLYHHARNPMYVAVLTIVAGWAVALGSLSLGAYLAVLAIAFHLRVIVHEEPWLQRQFGAAWTAYAASVPRWLPLLRRHGIARSKWPT